MILQALYQLAEDEGLIEDPDFEMKPISFLIQLEADGRLLGVQDTRTEQNDGKRGKPRPKSFSVPRCGARTSGDRAFFLFDKAEYVLGADPDGKRKPDKLALRARLFREAVADCAKETEDPAVEAVLRFLEDVAEGRQEVALPEDCAGNDLFAFIVQPDIDRLVTQRPEVVQYWKAQRQASQDAEKVRCLVTGEESSPANLFPGIKKVPGGSTSGVGLVSFNQRAFESYGWKGNENAPVSQAAAESCATALNRLLDPNAGIKLHYRLSADTVVCFWARGEKGRKAASLFSVLLAADPAEVEGAYRSIWRGKPPEVGDSSAFYALTLSGTQGRAIVRDWLESTVDEALTNLARYFDDIDIVRNTPKPKERELPPQLSLSLLLEALAPGGKRENVPAPLSAKLMRSIFSGQRYPLSVMQKAIGRMRAEMGRGDWIDQARRDARAALIKAVLNRNYGMEVRRDMDPTNRKDGYVLGRLMAVLERLQAEAQGNVNATVIDRYFSGASAAPKSVFPRLMKNARNHVRKLREDKGGLVFWLERMLDECAGPFETDAPYPNSGGNFPAYLSLEQQGLFILGYHQMRRWLWMTQEERAAWEAKYPNAPKAYKKAASTQATEIVTE